RRVEDRRGVAAEREREEPDAAHGPRVPGARPRVLVVLELRQIARRPRRARRVHLGAAHAPAPLAVARPAARRAAALHPAPRPGLPRRRSVPVWYTAPLSNGGRRTKPAQTLWMRGRVRRHRAPWLR